MTPEPFPGLNDAVRAVLTEIDAMALDRLHPLAVQASNLKDVLTPFPNHEAPPLPRLGYRVGVTFLLDAATLSEPGEACDWMAETLRPLMQRYGGLELVDWSYTRSDFPEVVVIPPDYEPDDNIALLKAYTPPDPYEAAARAHGWTHGGDNGGIIYNQSDYGSWKEAMSWSGTDGENDNGAVYENWRECCEAEDIPASIRAVFVPIDMTIPTVNVDVTAAILARGQEWAATIQDKHVSIDDAVNWGWPIPPLIEQYGGQYEWRVEKSIREFFAL